MEHEMTLEELEDYMFSYLAELGYVVGEAELQDIVDGIVQFMVEKGIFDIVTED